MLVSASSTDLAEIARSIISICHDGVVTVSDLVLVSASAYGVLGEYDHSFTIDISDQFVILYGPNGVGKTRFLEIINALSRLNGSELLVLPFQSATLEYSDGTVLSVVQQSEQNGATNGAHNVPTSIDFKLRRPRRKAVHWEYKDDGFESWAIRMSPYQRISEHLWEDPNDGEIVNNDELRAQFEHVGKSQHRETAEYPAVFGDFVKLVPSFLIETQRLRIENLRPSAPRRFRSSGRTHPKSRIVEQAEKIRSLVNAAQTEHSKITQRLDRTFPNRVLSAKTEDLVPDSIRARYNEQNEFRSRLGQVASVGLDDELSLPEGDLKDWALELLNLYLNDADEKLQPFEDLIGKIELLEQIINQRLLNKRLQVTDGEGLAVRHSTTGRPIALDSLSSGEQHEIILMIDLLFNVPRGAIVLIDEPEISLHVVWQLTFIPDVKQIAELAGFRFVVATHSPQIINDAWDRAIRLGPPEVAFA